MEWIKLTQCNFNFYQAALRYFLYNKILRIKPKKIFSHFVNESTPLKINGLVGYVRKDSTDYYLLFLERERVLKGYLDRVAEDSGNNSEGIFIDVGSNVGGHAIRAAMKSDKVHVYAFEANPSTFSILEKNVLANRLEQQVTCINKAVYNVDNQKLIMFEEVTNDQYKMYGNATIINKRATEFSRRDSFVGRIENRVETIRLDSFINQRFSPNQTIELVKIDVEGAEVGVLEGAIETLKRTWHIIVEVHQDNLGPVNAILQRHFPVIEKLDENGMVFLCGSRNVDNKVEGSNNFTIRR